MMRDGPAEGFSPLLGRAPVFLRVVIDRTTGKRDALDQLDDTPRAMEDVHVYVRRSTPGYACGRGAGGSGMFAEYEYVPDVDTCALRDNEAWRAWCQSPERDELLCD